MPSVGYIKVCLFPFKLQLYKRFQRGFSATRLVLLQTRR